MVSLPYLRCVLTDHSPSHNFHIPIHGVDLPSTATIGDLVVAVEIDHGIRCRCQRETTGVVWRADVTGYEGVSSFVPSAGDVVSHDTFLRDCPAIPGKNEVRYHLILETKEIDESLGTHRVVGSKDACVVRRVGSVARLPSPDCCWYHILSDCRGILVVDKTRFLNHLTQRRLMTLARPSGCGTSTLLSMVESYLDLSSRLPPRRLYFPPQPTDRTHNLPPHNTLVVRLALSLLQLNPEDEKTGKINDCRAFLNEAAYDALVEYNLISSFGAHDLITWDAFLKRARESRINVFVGIDSGDLIFSRDVQAAFSEAISEGILARIATGYDHGFIHGSLLVGDGASCPHALKLCFPGSTDLSADAELYDVCGMTKTEILTLGQAARIDLLAHLDHLTPLNFASSDVDVYNTSHVLQLGRELAANTHDCLKATPVLSCYRCEHERQEAEDEEAMRQFYSELSETDPELNVEFKMECEEPDTDSAVVEESSNIEPSASDAAIDFEARWRQEDLELELLGQRVHEEDMRALKESRVDYSDDEDDYELRNMSRLSSTVGLGSDSEWDDDAVDVHMMTWDFIPESGDRSTKSQPSNALKLAHGTIRSNNNDSSPHGSETDEDLKQDISANSSFVSTVPTKPESLPHS